MPRSDSSPGPDYLATIKRLLTSNRVEARVQLLRVISPFPGYLASVWLEAKKIMREDSFLLARDRLNKRALGLLSGLPVRDHHAAAKHVTTEQWKEIEEMVDGFARLTPPFALLAAVWHRSFPSTRSALFAA